MKLLILVEQLQVHADELGFCYLKIIATLLERGDSITVLYEKVEKGVLEALPCVEWCALPPHSQTKEPKTKGWREFFFQRKPQPQNEVLRRWKTTLPQHLDSRSAFHLILVLPQTPMLTPAIALQELHPHQPWMVNVILTPPLQHPRPFLRLNNNSSLQRIVEECTYLLFQSKRLTQSLARRYPKARKKSLYLPFPHADIASLPSEYNDCHITLEEGCFNLLLFSKMGECSTHALFLTAFAHFVERVDSEHRKVYLYIVGELCTKYRLFLQKHHLESQVHLVDFAISNRCANRLMHQATALIHIDTNPCDMQTLPTLLSAYISSRKPLLVLSSYLSEITHFLTYDYPYICMDMNEGDLFTTLLLLWEDYNGECLEEVYPPEVDYLVSAANFNAVIEMALKNEKRRALSRSEGECS